MPLSAAYAWYLTRLMQRYRIPDAKPAPVLVSSNTPSNLGGTGHPAAGEEHPATERPKPRETKLG
jgi:hypothetical protein